MKTEGAWKDSFDLQREQLSPEESERTGGQ
jgi:hypothetical protein